MCKICWKLEFLKPEHGDMLCYGETFDDIIKSNNVDESYTLNELMDLRYFDEIDSISQDATKKR